jgi:hypothetical protein
MLARVWQELKYRIDVCGVTRGAQIERLWLSKKTFLNFPVAVYNSIKVGPLVYVSCFCNPRVHYEMPCIREHIYVFQLLETTSKVVLERLNI